MEKENNEIELPPTDEIFSISARFSIMFLLYINKKISFTNLQKLLNLTPGNLSHHLNKLMEQDFIETKKMIFSKRPINMIFITEKGKEEFSTYLSKFKSVLDRIEKE
ncbi:MAG: hypothetical protein HeimAB125_22750 [Candidatus Heimdallarchaeota archaeon AB_125]|nr:MAG: hypothetical protein HeimAB125_22750 [Candidatus Heimdallarchaeota archaeon AB_125]